MTRIKRVSAGVAPVFRFGRITEPAVLTCCLLRMARAAEGLKVRRVKEQAKVAFPGSLMIDHRGRLTTRDARLIALQMSGP
jgi:hypothetical protein